MPRPKRVISKDDKDVNNNNECTSTKRGTAASNNTVTTTTNKFATRLGVDASIRLSISVSSDVDVKLWEQIENRYNEMLQQKGGTELIELDNYCETNLGKRLQDYSSTSLLHHKQDDRKKEGVLFNQNDLMKVVQWKFLKGKARPMLYKFIKSNNDIDINTAITKSIKILSNLSLSDYVSTSNTSSCEGIMKTALEQIASLKGVGPATASVILSIYKPELFTFMDDEVIEALFFNKRTYTITTYMNINKKCIDIAQKLNTFSTTATSTVSSTPTSATPTTLWTARRVGKTLWTAAKLASTPNEVDLTTDASQSTDTKINKDHHAANGFDDNDFNDDDEKKPSAIQKKKQKR